MVCKITTTRKQQQGGFTLVEVMVASGIALLALLAITSLSLYTSRSFAALSNYTSLDELNQFALDKMSKEIRQVNALTAFAPTSLTFEDYDGGQLRYAFDAGAGTLVRSKDGESETLLTGCDFLEFSMFQRTPIPTTFEPYPTAVTTNAKVIQVTWNCSRKILGVKANTESMQSAKIMIRQK